MMDFIQDFKDNLFKTTPDDFNEKALKLFRYQAANNPVYKQYLENLRFDINSADDISRVPFLPIGFFKNHDVLTGNPEIKEIFNSSGTTGSVRSRHLVADPDFYKKISAAIFRKFYGDFRDHIFISLLPSYQENPGSSLIFMINHFMQESGELSPGFLPKDLSRFPVAIEEARAVNKKIVLFGVGFALLDLAAVHHGLDLSDLIMIETGGMKGRREEMTRPELHELLKKSFNLSAIHSEYGMTELLSQAYARKDGAFEIPFWMRIFVREINDPFSISNFRNGGINIVDLANVQSCAFIETEDIGRKLDNNTFEVLGRFDNSDVRGCNLLYFS
jgi:hypothetical protein